MRVTFLRTLPVIALPILLAGTLGVPLTSGGGEGGLPDALAAGSETSAAAVDPAPPVNPFDAVPLALVREGDPLPGAQADQRVSFLLRVRDVVVPYPVLAVTAVPGESLELEILAGTGAPGPDGFVLRTADGVHLVGPEGRWRWQAPLEPGPYPVRVESPADGEAIHLNLLVLHPFEQIRNHVLEGYRIGEYRPGPGRATPPSGFFRAADDYQDLRVAPSFTLGQFLCKQPGDPPFLALSEPLLLKLEALVEEVRDAGYPVATLHVMSGFRTPHYNRAIGNTTDGSRHLWGDAADVFIDTTGNGWMDDLNGDGRGGDADGRILLGLAERVEARAEAHVRPGGLSLYRTNAVRGPFIHVDARGTPARW
jgi:hypothetical protein